LATSIPKKKRRKRKEENSDGQTKLQSAANTVSDGADLMMPAQADPQSAESTESAQSDFLVSSQADPQSAANAVSDGADRMMPVQVDPVFELAKMAESMMSSEAEVMMSGLAQPQSGVILDDSSLSVIVLDSLLSTIVSPQSTVDVSSKTATPVEPQQSALFLQNLWSTSTESLSATVISTLSSPAEPQSTTSHVRGRKTVTKK